MKKINFGEIQIITEKSTHKFEKIYIGSIMLFLKGMKK